MVRIKNDSKVNEVVQKGYINEMANVNRYSLKEIQENITEERRLYIDMLHDELNNVLEFFRDEKRNGQSSIDFKSKEILYFYDSIDDMCFYTRMLRQYASKFGDVAFERRNEYINNISDSIDEILNNYDLSEYIMYNIDNARYFLQYMKKIERTAITTKLMYENKIPKRMDLLHALLSFDDVA